MTSFQQEATSRTPEVELDSAKGIFTLKGRSYLRTLPAFLALFASLLMTCLSRLRMG